MVLPCIQDKFRTFLEWHIKMFIKYPMPDILAFSPITTIYLPFPLIIPILDLMICPVPLPLVPLLWSLLYVKITSIASLFLQDTCILWQWQVEMGTCPPSVSPVSYTSCWVPRISFSWVSSGSITVWGWTLTTVEHQPQKSNINRHALNSHKLNTRLVSLCISCHVSLRAYL